MWVGPPDMMKEKLKAEGGIWVLKMAGLVEKLGNLIKGVGKNNVI